MRQTPVFGSLLACLVVLGADLRAQEVELAGIGAISERFSETALISGRLVTGFLADGSDSPKRPNVGATIPASWANGPICLRLMSADGRYEGSKSFQVPADWRGGDVLLPLGTAYGAYLADTRRQGFAALASKGRCDSSGDLRIAPVRWNETLTGGPKEYTLQLNSYRADEVYILIARGRKPISCKTAESAKRTAFDFTCVIPATDLEELGEARIEINRSRRGNFEQPNVFIVDRK